ncbi:hemicentin-1 [Bicyclus anynana]|uniref:Hemicentin-1 n=1 Tax=Bicyclus anynana TaxID=110368 RepID=A0ABM3LZN3_BICAN|nr:hemicentin-1 [Bicyclus anynana]
MWCILNAMIVKKTLVLISFLVLLSNVSGKETKVSTTFVIDSTYSMDTEIGEVKRRTDDIFNAVYNSNSSIVDEFIIVTFNDPATGWGVEAATLEVKTNKRDEFETSLRDVKVLGGADCPEMSLTGIELGLNTSKPHSYLYVFTDASAKDYQKYDYVKSLALKKSIQVTFLLTGQCKKDKVEEQHTVYNNLATATSGQVFHILKQEISQIIDYILVNLNNKRTTLLRKTFQDAAECEKKYNFTVDSDLWEIVIALSAPKSLIDDDLDVIGPDGSPAEIQQFVSSQNTTIVKLKGEVGEYSISVTNCADVTVHVTASTSISFQHGFSSDKPRSLDETAKKPVKDKKSYLAIVLDDKEQEVILKTVELWNIDDDFIIELPLKLIDSDQQLYITEPFSVPQQTFKIAVKGLTKSKELLTRVSPTTIEYEEEMPKEKPATVTILGAQEVIAKFGEALELKCKVGGFPQPHITWEDKYNNTMNSSINTIALDEYISTLHINNVIENTTFICKAKNFAIDFDFVIVTTNKKFTVKKYPEDVAVEIGKSVELSLKIDASPPVTIIWFQDGKEINNNENLEIKTSSGSSFLKIKNAKPGYDGKYSVKASNGDENVEYKFNVILTGAVPALIVPVKEFVQNIMDLVEGDKLFQLICIATGNPKPTLKWLFNGITIEDNERYDILYGDTLIVKDVSSKSKGTYTCKAENEYGNDTMDYEVNVHPYPPINNFPSNSPIYLVDDQTFKMPCGDDMIAINSIRWYKDGHLIGTGPLTLNNVTKANAGNYTCRISKSYASYSYHSRILVGSKVKFLTEGNTRYITFEEGAEAQLDCSATGDPTPKTKWIMNNKIIEGGSQYSFIMKNNNNIPNWKNIKCCVSNEFGTIQRDFEIVAGECLMSLEDDFTSRQPILTTGNRKRSWPVFTVSNGFLRILKHRYFTLFCPESFISHNNENYGNNITTYCVGDSMFQLEGKAVLASEITCDKNVVPLAKNFNQICRGSNTTLIGVGFDVGGSFMSVYSVCFDNFTKTPLFVVHDIHKAIANMTPIHKAQYTRGNYLTLEYEDMYDCRNQINAISSFIGKSLKSDEKCCFMRRQLVNPKDVLPGVAQVATYHYLNVVPQWSTCGSENWDEVERRVRMYTINTDDAVPMWTGATSVRNKTPAIYLKDKLNQKLQVPQYIWRVVKDQLAVIHVNVPDLTLSTASSYILCKDICNTIPWMMYEHWQDVDKGFIYCCSIEDFEKAFDYDGYRIFG